MMRLLLALVVAVQAGTPAFEAASVKPVAYEVLQQRRSGIGCNTASPVRFSCVGPLRILLAQAYDIPLARSSQDIVGAPKWVEDDLFDIEATMSPGPSGRVSSERVYAMLRALLADRFKLVVHRERKEVPSYALVIASKDGKLGPQLQPTPTACADWIGGGHQCSPPLIFGDLPCGRGEMRGNVMRQSRAPLSQLATLLSPRVERPVEDRTGLTGMYAFDLRWAALTAPAGPSGDTAVVPDNVPSSIFTALQEQLGLRLEPARTMGDFLVIDRIERPAPN